MNRFSILVGDITRSGAEAIVSAELLAEYHTLGTCEMGKAKLTHGCTLPTQYILHTSAPIWQSGQRGEAALLASCYRSCLELAVEHGIRTVDFPSIATGAHGYPLPLAATVALKAIMDFLAECAFLERVRMVCCREEVAAVYRQAWNFWYAESKADCMKSSPDI